MELNDTLLTATDTGIVESSTGTFAFTGEIGDNAFDTNDVDLYSLALAAGSTVSFDVDADINGSFLDSILRVFDADGNEVTFNDDDGSLDSFISFVSPVSGTYFVGVSSFSNFDYDPTIENSGEGFSDGEYDLFITLINSIQGDNGSNSITGTLGADSIQGFGGNDVIQARAGNDTVLGGVGRDLILGGTGDDFAIGSLGADTIGGDGGDDTLSGGANRDSLLGGGGDDTLLGGQDRDTLRGEGGNDRLQGGSGNDFLLAGSGSDTVQGGDGNDRMNGNGGDDSLLGGSGSDTIRGGSGDDTLRGGTEDDILIGGLGSDSLLGGSGRDTMTGGAGADTFVYQDALDGLDTITDFEAVDQIDVSRLLFQFGTPSFNSDTPFEDYIRLVQVGVSTQVRFDTGGDQVNNRFVTLATLQNVDASSLTTDNFIF